MKRRMLRIGWTGFWGIAAVLLCVLWVRSFWRTDFFQLPIGNARAVGAQSYTASMSVIVLDGRGRVDSLDLIFQASNTDGRSRWKQEHGTLGGFAMTTTPISRIVTTPDWFLILLAIAIGGLAWLPLSPQRFSFIEHRRLSIAWSAAWIAACLAPIAVWLGGYSSAGAPAVWHGHNFRFESGKLLMDETIQSMSQPISDANYELGDGTGRWGVMRTTTVTIPRRTFPAWSVVPLLAVMATLPWLRWSTRFSLRTLLIATTLVALGLGIVAWLCH